MVEFGYHATMLRGNITPLVFESFFSFSNARKLEMLATLQKTLNHEDISISPHHSLFCVIAEGCQVYLVADGGVLVHIVSKTKDQLLP